LEQNIFYEKYINIYIIAKLQRISIYIIYGSIQFRITKCECIYTSNWGSIVHQYPYRWIYIWHFMAGRHHFVYLFTLLTHEALATTVVVNYSDESSRITSNSKPLTAQLHSSRCSSSFHSSICISIVLPFQFCKNPLQFSLDLLPAI